MKRFFQAIAGPAPAVILLLVASCATAGGPPLPENSSGAAFQIGKWVPLGTTATEAKKILQAHGFTCTLERDTRLSAELVTDDLYGELIWPATRSIEVPQRRWQVFLFLKNDQVANISVATMLLGR